MYDMPITKKGEGLTAQEAMWLLDNVSNPWVRIDPRCKGKFVGPGWGRGQLIGVNPRNNTALVKPAAHLQIETIELRYLRKWHSRNEIEVKPSLDPLSGKPFNSMADKLKDAHSKINQSRKEERTATIGRLTYVAPPKKEEPKPAPKPVLTVVQPTKPEPKQLELPALQPEPKPEPKKEEPMQQADKRGGLRERRYTKAQKIEAVRLYEMGKERQEISIITGIDPKNVTHVLWQHKKNKEMEAELERLERLTAPTPVAPPPAQKPYLDPVPMNVAVQVVPVTTPKMPEKDLQNAIRAILKTPMTDTAKLLAIDALTS